ncbi:MAG: DUF5618 family protein [Raineya sp.]
MAVEKKPIDEAKRYVANAKDILANQKIEGKYYQDPKYIRMAGNTLWNGVLIALEAVLQVSKKKSKGSRPNFDDYKEAASKIDKKITTLLGNAYETIHKSLGYDGNLNVGVVKAGFEEAKEIIKWCEMKYNPNGKF